VSAATVVCLACRVDFDGQPDEAHAAYFAGVHDDLHHGSTPTAFPTSVDLADDAAPVSGPRGPWGGDAA
jgi:hypothetical protein